MEDGGREVGVGTNYVGGVSSSDTGSPDYKGDVDIFLKSAFFAWVETVLRDVVAIVRGVDDVCIVQDAMFLELCHNTVNKLVHCLESLEAGTVEVIVILDDSRVKLWESLDPRGTARLEDVSHSTKRNGREATEADLIRIEVFRPRYLGLWEKVFVSLSRDRWGHRPYNRIQGAA